MAHFDEMTCLQYLDGQLDAARGAELRGHVAQCRECGALLRALQQESLLLQSAMQEADEAVPARLLNPAAKEKLPWLWLTLLGFASAGVYTLVTNISQAMTTVSQAGFSGSNLLTVAFFNTTFWTGWGDVMDMMQIAAALTLGVPAVWLVWRYRRRMSPAGMMLASLAAALFVPATATAADVHKDKQNYELPEGQVVKKDLIVMSGKVDIRGTVEGDLIAFSESVTISETGRVTGDLIVFTRRLRVGGQVDGDVRSIANTITLESAVAKNVMLFGETIEADSKSQVGGSALMIGKIFNLDGRIARDLMMAGERADLNGFVGGDVDVAGAHLTVGSSAEIQGKAEFKSGNDPNVSPQAKLASPFTVTRPVRKARYSDPGYYFGQLVRLGVSFIYGIAVLLLLPSFFREVVGAARQYGPALGFGTISLIVVPILALIACITIVGLAVGIGAVMMYLVALYSAKVIVGTWVGQKLLGPTTTTGGLIGRMAVGLVILRIAGALPYVGGWITLIYCIFGLGAVALAIYNRMRSAPVMPAEPAPVAV